MKDSNLPTIRVIELYEEYLINNSIINYLSEQNIAVVQFAFFKYKKKKFLNKMELIVQEIKCLFILIRHIHLFRNEIILCSGGQIAFSLLIKVFGGFLGKEFHFYMYNFYLHRLGNKKYIRTILKFILKSDKTTIIVQSPEEINYFSPLSKNKIYFVPYCNGSLTQYRFENIPETNYVFSGGYTNRDYILLIESAKQNPDLQFVIVKSSLNQKLLNYPQNVIIYNDIEPDIFKRLLVNSKFVIVPLKDNVGSSGQMLCIDAMQMGKPVIYCNISAINYYFIPNVTGIPYERGNLNSLNTAIKQLSSSELLITSISNKAFERYNKLFTLECRNVELTSILIKKV